MITKEIINNTYVRFNTSIKKMIGSTSTKRNAQNCKEC